MILSGETLELMHAFHASPRVARMDVSPDGSLLVTGSSAENAVRFWNTETWEPVGEPLIACGGASVCVVVDVTFSPDGSQLAVSDFVLGLVLWDLEARAPLGAPYDAQRGSASDAMFTPDGARIVSLSRGGVALWDTVGAGLISRRLPDAARGTAGMSADGSLIAVQHSDGNWSLWDADTLSFIRSSVGAPPGRSNSPIFSPDGRLLVTTHSEGCGGTLALCDGGWVAIWHVGTGMLATDPIPTLKAQSFLPIAISPDGKLLAIGSADGTAQLWDLEALAPATEPFKTDVTEQAEPSPVAALTFAVSADQRLLASRNLAGDVVVWDYTTSPPTRLEERAFGNVVIGTIAFTPDGLLAVGYLNGTIELLDPATLQPVGPPLSSADDSPIYSLRFSDDGAIVAAGGLTGGSLTGTRVFDRATGQQLGESFGDGDRDRLVEPDGSFIVVASDEGVVITSLDPDEWEAQACRAAGRNLSQAEWDEFFPGRDYEATCPQWPVGAEPVSQ